MAAKKIAADDPTTVGVSSRIPHCLSRIPITDLNPHLTCALCTGYFVDATTVVECLHSFCRACLLSYLETSDTCPICDIQINENQLHKSIRSDHTLQDLVYKLIPGLYKTELQRRKEFCSDQCKNASSEPCTSTAPSTDKLFEIFDKRLVDLASSVCAPDEIVSFSLEFYRPPPPQPLPAKRGRRQTRKRDSHTTTSELTPALKDLSYKRYFRCPAAVKMTHLKKLLSHKLDLTNCHQVDIWHLSTDSIGDELLPEDLSLRDVAFIYSWNRKAPLRLHFNVCKYEIEEEPMPKLRREELVESTGSENPSPECSTKECPIVASNSVKSAVLFHQPESAGLLLTVGDLSKSIKTVDVGLFTGEISQNNNYTSLPLERDDYSPEISPSSATFSATVLTDRGILQPAKLRFKKSLISVVQQLANSNGTVASSNSAPVEVPDDPNHVNGRFTGEMIHASKSVIADKSPAKTFKRENVESGSSINNNNNTTHCAMKDGGCGVKNLRTTFDVFCSPAPIISESSNPNIVPKDEKNIAHKNKTKKSINIVNFPSSGGSTGKCPQAPAKPNAESLLCT